MIQKILLFSQPSSWLFLFSWFQRTEWQWQQDRDLSWRMSQSFKVNQNYFFKFFEYYHNQTNKVDPVPEWMRVLNKVHDISPALQWYHQEYCHPGQAYVVKWYCSMEGVGGTCGALGVVLKISLKEHIENEQRDLVPVDASLFVSCLLHTETTLCWSILVEWKISTTMHPVVVTLGANVRWHEVIIIKLVVETGDSDKTSTLQLLNLSSPTHWIQVFEWASSDNIHWCSISVSADLPTSELRWYRRWRRRRSTREERCQAWEEYQGATSQEFSCLQRT